MEEIKREYPSQPLVGVGALVRDGDKILLVKRVHEPAKGLWSIPGGLVELGETVLEAAKREVREETNIEIETEGLLDVVDNINRDEQGRVRFHYVLVDFLARPINHDLKPVSDVSDAKWVPASDLANYKLTYTARRLLKKIGVYRE